MILNFCKQILVNNIKKYLKIKIINPLLLIIKLIIMYKYKAKKKMSNKIYNKHYLSKKNNPQIIKFKQLMNTPLINRNL
jgi:hypothetical protein